MGFLKRKKSSFASFWEHADVEELDKEIARIKHKKQELEHRLEILCSAKSESTVIIIGDLSEPECITHGLDAREMEIEDITSELRILDLDEEILELERASKERAKQRKKRFGEEWKATFSSEEGRHTDRGRDLYHEVTLSEKEASQGIEKTIQYKRGKEEKKLIVKIPPGTKDGTRIRLRGVGSVGNPPGDLYIIVKIKS